ncbi:MAG: hypothetical protein OXI63_08005 [Candidatus Poribacteria bacterium]|nr:hypothetical protein [Candidatus Poribacteria bacterium]
MPTNPVFAIILSVEPEQERREQINGNQQRQDPHLPWDMIPRNSSGDCHDGTTFVSVEPSDIFAGDTTHWVGNHTT